jgi:DNA replication protein DnaC
MDSLYESFERMARAAGKDLAEIAEMPVPEVIEEDDDDFERVRSERERVFFTSLPDLCAGMTFESWYTRAPIADAVKKVRTWAEAYPDVEAGLFLTSHESGTGKTHMAVACGRLLAAKGVRVRLVNVVALLNRIRKSFSNDGPGIDLEALGRYCDVLIFDDLGAEDPKPWVVEKFYLLLNTAVTNGTRLIVTSNDDYGVLAAKLDKRVVDRIVGATDRIDFETTSYRVLQHKRRKA